MTLSTYFMKNYALNVYLDRIVVPSALPEDLQISLRARAFTSVFRTRRTFSPISDMIN